jgi:hypothetical protein
MSKYYATQEEGRFIKLLNNTLLILYCGSYGKFNMNYKGFREAVQFYSIGKIINYNGKCYSYRAEDRACEIPPSK